MAAVSGQYGKIVIGSSNVVECMGWSFKRAPSIKPYASCATSGYKKRVVGTREGSGNLKGMQDPSDPIENFFVDGSSVTLKLYYTAAKFYSVPAIIESLDIDVDIDDGSPVPWAADFGTDGGWTLPT